MPILGVTLTAVDSSLGAFPSGPADLQFVRSLVKGEISVPTRHAPTRRVTSVHRRSPWRCGAARHSHARQYGTAEPAASGTRRVLVVDDEPAIRVVCRVNLAAAGIDVLEAADGESGLELAKRERPDLILLDVMMPGFDGWDVARKLAEDPATREIPIVFLTARAEMTDRRRAQLLGGVGYIVKPFDPVDLGEVVEGVLTRIERGERGDLQSSITQPGDHA